jgi:hypothetical protein
MFARSIDVVETAVQLALRQIVMCVSTLTEERPELPTGLGRALYALPLSLPSEVAIHDARPIIWPLTFDYLAHAGERLETFGQPYLQDVRRLAEQLRPRDLTYSARSLEAFASRRSRAVATARVAFEEEESQLGDAFDPNAIGRREFGYVIINETSGLLSLWLEGYVADALAVAAAALRAAFWLWLEDDDRSLVLARSVLEQTARLRTWRLKPEKATTIEARGERTSTRDWLEEAGWRRLSILNRSLGEFSDATPSAARWSGAREALAQLQDPDDDLPAAPLQTARGSALNQVAFAFGNEVTSWCRRDYPVLAEALATVLPYSQDDEPGDEIEAWLRRCWDQRGLSLGTSDFVSHP